MSDTQPMNMPRVTVVYGLTVTALGSVLCILSSDYATAGIVGGVLLVVLGLLARNESRLKLTMHIAVMLGLLGAVYGLFITAVQCYPAFSPAWTVIACSALLSTIYVALCVRSFIDIRKRREADDA